MTTVLARYDGRVLVPDRPLDVSTEDLLEVTITVRPRTAAGHAPGSPAAVLAAMRAMPRLSAEDVAELERSIDAGKVTGTTAGIFDDVAGE